LLQPVRLIERVARFMAQDATTLGFTGTFDFEHLIALEAHKPWMGKVKRNGKA
jgi:hypothetical protein